MSLLCTFPDLRDDRLLKGAVRHAVDRQLRALETQKEHGAFVHKLIEFGQQLLRRVLNVPVYVPSPTHLATWLRRPLRTEHFIGGLQAIEWTVEERGLAGISLAPDVWLEWDSMTLIVDAKYKRHWEELQQHSWWGTEEKLREQHRNDLLQALAYANLARTSQVLVCLAYPYSLENWTSLRERGRLIHRADLTVGSPGHCSYG